MSAKKFVMRRFRNSYAQWYHYPGFSGCVIYSRPSGVILGQASYEQDGNKYDITELAWERALRKKK